MSETMDVVGSLRKISRELADLNSGYELDEILDIVTGASWLIQYISDGLEVEFLHAAERGRRLAMKQLGEGQGGEFVENTNGQRIYRSLNIESITGKDNNE